MFVVSLTYKFFSNYKNTEYRDFNKKYKDLSLNVNINYIIDIFKFILKSYTHIVYIYLFLFFYTINAQSIQDVQRLKMNMKNLLNSKKNYQ